MEEGIKKDISKPDENKSVTPKTVKVTVYDDLLVGLVLKTKEGGKNGKTDSNGQFDYQIGKTVEFFIGELKIGSTSSLRADKKIFLSDMLGLERGDYANPKLVKIAQILQSLDSVLNDGKKITPDEAKSKEISNTIKNKNKTLGTLNVKEDLKDISLTIPSEEEAQENIKDTLIDEGITPITPSPKPDADQSDLDTMNPAVATFPKDGSNSVRVDTNITLTFSEEMNTSTLTQENITLIKNGETQKIDYDINIKDKVVTLDPKADLACEIGYTLTLSNSITDKVGNALDETKIGFETEKILDPIDELDISEQQKKLLKTYKKRGIDLTSFIGEVPVNVKITTDGKGNFAPFDTSSVLNYTGKTTIALNENATEDKILLDMTKMLLV